MPSEPKSPLPNRVREAAAVYGPGAVSSYELVVAERGRIVLPQPLRDRLKIRPGDTLTVSVEDDGTMVIHTPRTAVAKLRGAFSHLSPERRAVDELIAERRREAAAEGDDRRVPAGVKRQRRRSR